MDLSRTFSEINGDFSRKSQISPTPKKIDQVHRCLDFFCNS